MTYLVCATCGHFNSTETDAPAASKSDISRRLDKGIATPNKKDRDLCPPCTQQALLKTLLEQGETALAAAIQSNWPLDASAAFNALPTPLRMRLDHRYTGRGVTLALIDAGFYPHPDLVMPNNRIRAWVDVSEGAGEALYFGPETTPVWPACGKAAPAEWHGLMTSTVAGGNGWLSRGLYAGVASEVDLVFVQVQNQEGRVPNDAIVRALSWILQYRLDLGINVVNISVGGDPVWPLVGNAVDNAVATLVASGVTVVVAAGNDGRRHLLPPATACTALTVGGLDDQNGVARDAMIPWHSNFGRSAFGAVKPEVIAPSIWVVAPLLPESDHAQRAHALFADRDSGNEAASDAIAFEKYITRHYKHVDGTSFAAPLVSGVVCCMLQANPKLSPSVIRDILIQTAHPLREVPVERQGSGAVDAQRAVAEAQDRSMCSRESAENTLLMQDGQTIFKLRLGGLRSLEVFGSWNNWHAPGTFAREMRPGEWEVCLPIAQPGMYLYKFLVDGAQWQIDMTNPVVVPDDRGGWNNVLLVPIH